MTPRRSEMVSPPQCGSFNLPGINSPALHFVAIKLRLSGQTDLDGSLFLRLQLTANCFMDLDFFKYVAKRLAFFGLFLAALCLLPGPRSLLDMLIAFLCQPSSVESFSSGLHLSLIHFCWLFGLPIPELEFPAGTDPLLVASTIVISLFAQLIVLRLISILWTGSMHHYYKRKALRDELKEFGEMEVEAKP